MGLRFGAYKTRDILPVWSLDNHTVVLELLRPILCAEDYPKLYTLNLTQLWPCIASVGESMVVCLCRLEKSLRCTQMSPSHPLGGPGMTRNSTKRAEEVRVAKRVPEGPRTQIKGFSAPLYYNIIGIWALKPYYSGPWTFI